MTIMTLKKAEALADKLNREEIESDQKVSDMWQYVVEPVSADSAIVEVYDTNGNRIGEL